MSNGTGEKSWDGREYGPCLPTQCRPNYHIEGSACVFNFASCSIDNGEGRKIWKDGAYSQCFLRFCDSGYKEENGHCVARSSIAESTYKPIVFTDYGDDSSGLSGDPSAADTDAENTDSSPRNPSSAPGERTYVSQVDAYKKYCWRAVSLMKFYLLWHLSPILKNPTTRKVSGSLQGSKKERLSVTVKFLFIAFQLEVAVN